MKIPPTQLPFLRSISNPIMLSAVPGIDTRASNTLYTSSPEDFDNWIRRPGAYRSTVETAVCVHELTDSLLPARVFENCPPAILWDLCLTRGQVELFLRENQRYLSGSRVQISFLIREDSQVGSRDPYFVRIWNYEGAQRQVSSRYLKLQEFLWQWDTRFVLPDIIG
jgi:hypothetical protein